MNGKKTNIWIKTMIGVVIIVGILAVIPGIVWYRYEEPLVTGAVVELRTEEADQENEEQTDAEPPTITSITEEWFQKWAEGHEGWQVPPSYRLKSAKIVSLDELEEGYIEVHYRAAISGWSRKVVQNLQLISTDTKNEYDGEWVLRWKMGKDAWVIEEEMSPVQYQIQTPEFAEETKEPQTAHFAYNKEQEQSYYVRDGVLYVTYDGGETFLEVPDGYDPVCGTPNGLYNEYLPENSYLVSEALTAFVGYQNRQTILIYSRDQGQTWKQNVIYEGGYRANTFLSATEQYCYATFAVDRTGGSDYYGTFRSTDLENWEMVSQPEELYSNATCVFWKDDHTGYYGKYNQYYLTQDGGASYELYELPQNEEIIDELGYNPYDSLEAMYQEDGFTYMRIGQGDDGDYARDGKLLKALYQSEDGIHFSFVEEQLDTLEEAG